MFRILRRGFTLIEVLSVIATLSVLIAMTLPALRSARARAESVASMSMLRQLDAALTAYTNDYAYSYPFFGKQTLVIRGTRIPPPRGHEIHPGVLGGTAETWASVILPYFGRVPEVQGRPIMVPDEDFPRHGNGEWDVYICRYFMTCTAFAGPVYWQTGGPCDPLDIHATRTTQVLFPSRKGILIDSFFDDIANPGAGMVRICFGDGSVREESWQSSKNVQPPPEPKLVGQFLHWPIMATEGGLAGIDY